jgi:homoserine kinase type II
VRRTDGSSFVSLDGSLWELAPWLPGRPDFRPARFPERLQAALQILAEFHLATVGFTGAARARASPTIMERQVYLDELIRGRAEQIASHIRASVWPELEQRARSIVRLFAGASPSIAMQLAEASWLETLMQPCIRDVHDEHILFDGNRVTGLIDFGAMRIDNVAVDIARLLGSMAVDDADGWSSGLTAYASVRPLSENERTLINGFDRSSILMSGMNWLNWIYVQGRQFADTRAVLARIDEILGRLKHLAKGL